jgi:hypothetical protein
MTLEQWMPSFVRSGIHAISLRIFVSYGGDVAEGERFEQRVDDDAVSDRSVRFRTVWGNEFQFVADKLLAPAVGHKLRIGHFLLILFSRCELKRQALPAAPS